MVTAGHQQLGLLALSLVVGIAVASPALGLPVIVLLLAVVVVAVLVDRYGTRSLALGSLMLAGVFAPMNALRLGGAVTVADLFLVPCLILAVMARTAADATPSSNRRPVRPDILAGLLLIAGGILGSQFAVDLGASLSAIIRFGLAAVGVPLVFVALGPSRSELRLLSWAFIVGAAINSVAGVLTYNPLTRGIGLSIHSNHLATACLLASGLAAGIFLTGTRRSSWMAAALWGVLAVGILKSGSRAGVVGEVLLILMLLVLTGSTRILRWCIGVVLGVAVLLFLNLIPYDEQDALARLIGRDPSAVAQSDFERAQLRAKAVEGIEQHPLTGAGFEEARVAHNVYLQVWGAAGLIGLAGMAILWIAALRGLLDGISGNPWVLGASAAVVSFLIVAAASNILWDRYLWFTLALFVTGRTVHMEATVDAESPVGFSPAPV